MNKTEIMNNATRAFHRVGLKLKKHSPEILLVAGIGGTVASAVMACKATLKVNEVLDETKTNIEKIHTATDKGITEAGEEYTIEDCKKETTIVYIQTGVKLAKLYGPAIVLGGLSVGAILTSNNMLRKRNMALAAAYATVDKGFKEYRGRVIERFGEELDKELRYNLKTKEIEETVVNEDGTETVVKKNVTVAEGVGQHSEYAKFFDEGCAGWTKDPELNLTFVRMQERNANDLLKSKGHLFLNEVYDMVGIPRTKAGQVVGWIYDEKNPIGDNCVDFGIYNLYYEPNRNFVNGYERTILLDFNVDGPILDMI